MVRSVWKTMASVAAFGALLSASPVHAADESAPPLAPAPAISAPTPAETPAPAAASTPAADPVAAALADRIGALPKSMAPADRKAIADFYAARANAPLLVETGKGLSERGRAVMAALSAADDYGLKAVDYKLTAPSADQDAKALAESELSILQAALKYARDARGGRTDPAQLSGFLDRKPRLPETAAVVAGLATADDAGAYLTKFNPQLPEFERLRQAYLKARGGVEAAQKDVPDSPRVKIGQKNEAVAVVRERLKVAVSGGQDPQVLDKELAKAIKDYQEAHDLAPADGTLTPALRKALNTREAGLANRILANMEMWRWMPEDLGATYVYVNVPEFLVRVVKDGKVRHEERVVAGKVDTETPIFSAEMANVIFHPFWGVPDSIKMKELLPGLARGSNVLQRNGLRMQINGRDVNPADVDWSSTDIRRTHVYQPPGAGNVLGVVKFQFPNRHDVYMHDTPTKALFNAKERTFSHGCMRVRDPVKFAEVLLDLDKGWPAEKVRALAGPNGPSDNQVALTRKIPVHVMYFTVRVDEDGTLHTFKDVYDHEHRVSLALDGKASLIVKRPEELHPFQAAPISRLAEAGPKFTGPAELIKKLFGF